MFDVHRRSGAVSRLAATRHAVGEVTDITGVPTRAGFLILAVVVDAFGRRVAGWSMANHLRAELVLEAPNMALCQRRPDSVVHHSDNAVNTLRPTTGTCSRPTASNAR